MNILTPVVQDDLIFTSTYGGKTLTFRVTQTDGKFAVATVWSHKAQGYMSTPVVVKGVAYHHLKSQRAMAIAVATGKELWTSSESFGKYWSLVAQGDNLLALDQNGSLLLLKANPEKLDITDRIKISDQETWAHLAVSGDQLYIRELKALVAYRRSEARPGAAANLNRKNP
jgi:outer membrane protein assembly factor BamB